ncbi:MAG: hypothetical protein ACI3VN_05245 [Candidatus Onthomonas sp.]
MKLSQHTEAIAERVVCAKPGRVLLLKLCTAVLCLVGVAAVGAVVWAEITGYNLNDAPMIPRLILAALVILAGIGLFKSIEEKAVRLQLDFYKDKLVLTYESLPGLWREGSVRQQTEVPYASVTSAILSSRRQRLTLRSSGYTQIRGEDAPKTRRGSVSFSTLEARDVDFAALLERYGKIRTDLKD